MALAFSLQATASDPLRESGAPIDLDEFEPDAAADGAAIIDRVPPPSKTRYIQMGADLDTSFVVGSEFGDTKVDDSRTRLTFSLGAPLSRTVAVGLKARFAVHSMRFDGDGQFLAAGRPGSEPFDDLMEPSLAIGSRIQLIDGLEMEIAARAISRIEEGARFGGGLEGGGTLTLLGKYRDWVVLRLGVGVSSRFDDSEAHVSPVLRLRVRLHERLWAETGGRSGRLEFDLTDRVRIDLFGGVGGGRYRLEDRRDGPAGVGRGSIRFQRADIGLGTRIDVFESLRLIVEAGAVLSQTLEIQNENGDEFDKTETREPAFRGRIAFKWRF